MFEIVPEFEEVKKDLKLVSVDSSRRDLSTSAADPFTLTVNRKFNTINIGKRSLRAMEMDHAWYKLAFNSEKNIIAWKVTKAVDNDLFREKMKKTGWRFMVPDVNGQGSISVGRILNTFLDLKKEKYRDLVIKKNTPKDMLEGDKYYFVEIIENTEEDLNPVK